LLKLGGAALMGGVISGMHYTGMAAATFTEIDHVMASLPILESSTLEYMTGVVSILILGIAILASLNDQKRELLLTILQLRQTRTRLKEHTTDLATANEAIIALNEKLKEDNFRLAAELDIVRQMQQMILPNPEELEIDGLDIAGYMEAADEVGGDYYDVLNTDGVVTLGIGDVTGHGLESGILMLMAQTAVRTLKEIRETDPVRFLDALNRTLYKNVQRMNSEKSLTLAILNYSEGWVSISGQHEETLIVRNGGQVERMDTMDLGLPIALHDDIAEFISHISIELKLGDGIVLYTDGIPEAKDINKKQYGVEQMCEVISQNWHLSAQEIKQAVIDDLRGHIGTQKVFDDITLLVVKRTQLGVEKKSHPQAAALV
jgi:serine phosphatase RsbU (regulator of sigma subunit)